MSTDQATPAIDDLGWLASATHIPSPNFDGRPEGISPEILVIHNISLPPGQFGGPSIVDLFTNKLDFDAHPYFHQLRNLRVSAHFLIRRNGQLIQFVSTRQRAWHAGISSFLGRDRCNDFSIGVELEGTNFDVFTSAQYRTLAQLTHRLKKHYPLTHVVGHEHIAPLRKTDPGPHFDWFRYRENCVNLDTGNATALIFPPAVAS